MMILFLLKLFFIDFPVQVVKKVFKMLVKKECVHTFRNEVWRSQCGVAIVTDDHYRFDRCVGCGKKIRRVVY